MSATVRPFGLDAVLVSFGEILSEGANRAALALRGAIEAQDLPGVAEVSTALVSVVVRFDPLRTDPDALAGSLRALLDSRDWSAMPLPEGRRLWEVPAVFGTDLAPQLGEAAALAGLDAAGAVASLTAGPLRVLTIGFAPGQPYLGELDPAWNIPRQTDLTPQVPPGAVTVAIRQIVLFSVASPTGWRHVGQTALRLFDPGRRDPFLLRPGDEVLFRAVDRAGLEAARSCGGARLIPWR
ncbi:MAG: 5-oxoprolinase subunit B family protein [Gemmobacter sp.]